MTNQKTIALDLDSVLADVMYTWLEEYNLIYNTFTNKTRYSRNRNLHNILPISEKYIRESLYSCMDTSLERYTSQPFQYFHSY